MQVFSGDPKAFPLSWDSGSPGVSHSLPPPPCSGPSWARPGVTSPTWPGNGAPPDPFPKVQLRLSPGKPWGPLDEGSEVPQLWPHVSHLGGDTRLACPWADKSPSAGWALPFRRQLHHLLRVVGQNHRGF